LVEQGPTEDWNTGPTGKSQEAVVNEREGYSTGADARRGTPGREWHPDEPQHQDMLLRYLSAVTAVSSRKPGAQRPAEPVATDETTHGPSAAIPERAPASDIPVPAEEAPQPAPPAEVPVLLVRDVMDVPAASARGDMSYREIARMLSREHIGAVPVVDADDRVIGMVSESDLLAKAAVEASGHRPGPIGRLRERRLHEKAHGDTAATLMTSPAVTVLPGASVAEAAWLVALSRLKRLPVTDREGRLVGVVQRNTLLQALIRDDARIREEIEERIVARRFPAARDAVEITVRGGVVDLDGKLAEDEIPRLIAAIDAIDDVIEVNDHLAAT